VIAMQECRSPEMGHQISEQRKHALVARASFFSPRDGKRGSASVRPEYYSTASVKYLTRPVELSKNNRVLEGIERTKILAGANLAFTQAIMCSPRINGGVALHIYANFLVLPPVPTDDLTTG
jgi:hypothetical protein